MNPAEEQSMVARSLHKHLLGQSVVTTADRESTITIGFTHIALLFGDTLFDSDDFYTHYPLIMP